MASAKATTDHQTIRRWVEERGGHPARVKGTGAASDPGILRVDFPGFSGGETLEPIDWDSFFETFEDNELAFLFQDEPNSRFSKLISRDNMGNEDAVGRSARRERGSGPDAISLLESQHREVESLFEQLREAEHKRQREQLFEELADKLAAHTKIEETIFYPAVCERDTAALLHDAVDEHLAAKRMLSELMQVEADSREFDDKLAELERLIEHHVADEEQQLFVVVRDQDLIDLQVIGRKLAQRFDELIGGAPREQLANETDAAASLPC